MRRLNRRQVLGGTAAAGALMAGGYSLHSPAHAADPELASALPEGVRASAVLDALPGKRPLIKLAFRPPNYETPIEYFRDAVTPNDAFFVRYHLAVIPEVDPRTWRLSVGGAGANGQTELTLDDLKRMPAAEVVAVNQCSGNRRGLFQPHVPGVQWGYGAMGCARWKGARLKDVLDKVGLKSEAIEIQFDGADGPIVDRTPDFVKSIPVWKALEETTLIAYEMNGQPLPHFNGFPARLVVPGWTGTYWMKHLVSIKALTSPESGFWMKSAYRIPLGRFPLVARFTSQDTAVNTPITEMMVNSLITSHSDGGQAGAGSMLGGIAWDGGFGIRAVEVSTDNGQTWTSATLQARGRQTFMARASNVIGETQTAALIHNPAGYHHNVMHSITLNVA
jgi:DMSO/TMAO reductase YedYZ molybdopterin-dependent catalytic subunit